MLPCLIETGLICLAQAITAKYLLSIEGLGVSLLDDKPQELLYVSCGGLQLELACTAASLSLQASLRTMQVDNQLVCSTYPVLLRANPRAHARNPQFMQLSALYLRKHTSLHYLRHMSVFLQVVRHFVLALPPFWTRNSRSRSGSRGPAFAPALAPTGTCRTPTVSLGRRAGA